MKTQLLRLIMTVVGALGVTVAAPGAAAAQESPEAIWFEEDGSLTLSEVFRLALQRSPRLAAAKARVTAAEARTPQAGALPDPVFQIGVSSLELPGLTATMPASMAPVMSLGQGFPFPGKRGLREEMAASRALSTAAFADETWWQVRAAVSRAFYAVYSAERQLVVQVEAKRLLEEAQLIAEALFAAGSGRQTDVLRASVAVARLDGEIHRLVAARAASASRLNGLLDLPADTPVPEIRIEGLAVVQATPDTLRAWARATRPAIQAALREVERSDTGVELADKDFWPNLTVGVQYAQRPTDDGRKHMGGAMLGFSLPIYAGSKQHRAQDEANAERLAAMARLTEVAATVDADIGRVMAEIDRSRELLELYDAEILPQARATVESALSSYRSGSVDFLTLLDAELALTRFEAEFAVLLSDYGIGISDLEAAIGRPHPTTEALPWGIE